MNELRSGAKNAFPIAFHMKRFVAASLASIFLLGCGLGVGRSKAKLHNDFSVHCESIKDVAFVPPSVEVHVVSFGGSKSNKQKVRQIEDDLIFLIGQALSKRGFTIKSVESDSDRKIDTEKLFRDAEVGRLYETLTTEYKSSIKDPSR
ncbi:MAG: hypothetical protein ACU833_11550 [Gammaproteobacteria bacterium]